MKAGWINRKGELLPCKDWQHDQFARSLGLDPRELELKLWIKFSEANKSFRFNQSIAFHMKPTSAQINKCMDLAIECNMIDEFKVFMEWFED